MKTEIANMSYKLEVETEKSDECRLSKYTKYFWVEFSFFLLIALSCIWVGIVNSSEPDWPVLIIITTYILLIPRSYKSKGKIFAFKH